jgi:hypothetical protein
MEEDRLDLRPLDRMADPERVEALVSAIVAAAAPELARRASGGGLLAVLGGWAWPTLAAASLAAAVSAAALFSGRPAATAGPTVASVTTAGPVVTALELSDPVALWVDGNRGPTTADLVLAVERDAR